MAILRGSCGLVEQVSIDEAYLDYTSQINEWSDAVERAREIQQAVSTEASLSASLGVATNKLVAKVASDRDKPSGLTVVAPGEEATFLAPLPTRVLWGVGPARAKKLQDLGITTVGELALSSPAELHAQLGRHSTGLVRQAQGIDSRPVVTEHKRKSVSQERTFAQDIADPAQLLAQLGRMSERVSAYLQRARRAAGTVAIKLRYSNFETLSRQMTLSVPTADADTINEAALALLRKTWRRGRRVRLLGVAARNLSEPSGQMSLW
jgi:DNA polymerase-4